jgi:hypothetical protein
MHFITESVPGEITLMFISYLVFCTVLMYLFVRTDREWGSLEVSLMNWPRTACRWPTPCATRPWNDERSMFNNGLTRPSLQHCAQYHDVDCTCFMPEQKKSD